MVTGAMNPAIFIIGIVYILANLIARNTIPSRWYNIEVLNFQVKEIQFANLTYTIC